MIDFKSEFTLVCVLLQKWYANEDIVGAVDRRHRALEVEFEFDDLGSEYGYDIEYNPGNGEARRFFKRMAASFKVKGRFLVLAKCDKRAVLVACANWQVGRGKIGLLLEHGEILALKSPFSS
jgi:hypothetical protein